MRALVTDGKGGVGLADVALPEPAGGEVLVRVRAASLNRGELRVLGGAAGVVPGWDVAGELEDGTRVAALVDGGAWAEFAAVPLERFSPIPDTVAFATAAALPTAGLTALHAVQTAGSLLGKRVLVTGAAGGVGRYAVQLARAAGAHVVGVARDERRADGLRELGAELVVAEVGSAEGRFDLILESVGGDSLTAAFGLLAPHGDLVSFGGSSDAPAAFDPRAMFNNAPGARVHAYQVFEADGIAVGLRTLLELVRDGRLDPQVERVAGWGDAPQILAALAAREINGKAVIEID